MKKRILLMTLYLGLAFSNIAFASGESTYLENSSSTEISAESLITSFAPLNTQITLGKSYEYLSSLGHSSVFRYSAGGIFNWIGYVDGGVISCYGLGDPLDGSKQIITSMNVKYNKGLHSVDELKVLLGYIEGTAEEVETPIRHLYRWNSGDYAITIEADNMGLVRNVGLCNISKIKSGMPVVTKQLHEQLGVVDVTDDEFNSLVEQHTNELIELGLGSFNYYFDIPVAKSSVFDTLGDKIDFSYSGKSYSAYIGGQVPNIEDSDNKNKRNGGVESDCEGSYVWADYNDGGGAILITYNRSISKSSLTQEIERLIEKRKKSLNLEYIDYKTQEAWTKEFDAALGNINTLTGIEIEYGAGNAVGVNGITKLSLEELKGLLGESYKKDNEHLWRVGNSILSITCDSDNILLIVEVKG